MKLQLRHELPLTNIVEGWKRRSIRPNPEYQRGRAWSLDQRRLLIDSALRGYPLPRFYFSVEQAHDPLGNVATSLDVIDGVQRIIAFAEYLDDGFELFDPSKERGRFPRAVADAPAPWAGLRYSKLPPELRQQLADLVLPVVVIEAFDSSDELRDLFIRLQAGTALTRQQIRDAWPGTMSEYVVRVAGKLDRRGRFPFLSALDRRGSRREDGDELDDLYHDGRQTAAQLMRLFLDRKRGLNIAAVNARALDDLYHTEVDFDPQGELAREFERVVELAERVVVQHAEYTEGGTKRKVTKLQLFALFLALIDLASDLDVRVDREIGRIARAFWGADWQQAAGEIRPGKSTSRATIASYYQWFVSARLAGAGVVKLDPRRTFNDSERRSILAASGGLCQLCQTAVDPDDAEIDHIVPWIRGGKTTVENGRAVHWTCNRRRGEGRDEAA